LSLHKAFYGTGFAEKKRDKIGQNKTRDILPVTAEGAEPGGGEGEGDGAEKENSKKPAGLLPFILFTIHR
jgi:hypothetical protein